MTDNFDLIRSLLVFDNPDLFYYVQILQRKKENPQIGSNSRVIKDYFIGSLEKFNELEPEMKGLCTYFNARAMIRLNRRSYEQCHLKSIEKSVNQLMNKDYKAARTAYASACGGNHKDPNKTWIVDVDEVLDQEINDDLIAFINACQPEGDKFVSAIPSKNGHHLIVKPFNQMQFVSDMRRDGHILQDMILDIHKDNPTNLFIV